ncbi:MAG: M15 family metallopeptidase [Candidatus Nanopelagicales bacterium]|nr:M15 family metallopeptidase [Candidatus Nanopelagicales bacterium]MDZ4248605.1 M15 family metallopeptidase [Candidatus Nanopelagicales bacterium]
MVASIALAIPASGSVTTDALKTEADPPPFASVTRLTQAERRAMTPSAWRRGCPVPLRALRVVRVRHWTFSGRTRVGRLVVHRRVARQVARIMKDLSSAKFPIRRMRPIQRFGGSDYASIEADNTSAFNCRYVDGTQRWSMHAYGRAIDVNPIENPYVSRGRTSHPASDEYVARRPERLGMLLPGSAALRAFDAAGWTWGGRWRGAKDYQHVSAP